MIKINEKKFSEVVDFKFPQKWLKCDVIMTKSRDSEVDN